MGLRGGILRRMKFDPFLSDEPSLAPATPGYALVRLSQVVGGLRDEGKANLVPSSLSVPEWTANFLDSRTKLLEAAEGAGSWPEAFSRAQDTLRSFYADLVAAETSLETQKRLLAAFGFPMPDRNIETWLSPVDLSSLVLSHFKPEKQVFTTFSFNEAHGSMAYWLFEVRFFKDERLEDAVVENFAPQFSRIRLPVGPHRFFIETRNTHRSVRSQEFDIVVPEL